MSREVYYGHFSCKNRNVNEVRELTTYGTLTDLEFVIIFFLLCFNFTSRSEMIVLQKFSIGGVFLGFLGQPDKCSIEILPILRRILAYRSHELLIFVKLPSHYRRFAA
jgi:hypothetical protein